MVIPCGNRYTKAQESLPLGNPNLMGRWLVHLVKGR